MKELSKRLPWILASLLLLGFLVYGFWPKPVKVDITSVTRGSLLVTIDDDGETRIREKYLVAAPVTGKLLRVQLHAGDLVERSKTELMQLLPTDPSLLDARSQAENEARVQAADAAQAESDAMLVNAQEATSLAREQYQRALKLHNSSSISDAEFDETEHHHRMTEANLRSAEFRSKVKRYEKEVARVTLMRFTDAKDDGIVSPMKVVSPIDGRVLRVLHEDSSVVSAGTPILEIGDPQDLEMKIDVLSTDAVAIEAGAKVIIEYWGGDQPLHGTVRIVEPSAFLKISALGVEEKRVNVIVDFIEPWEERRTLGDGYRIEARIVTHSTNADSLKVAAGTLFRHEEGWHVYRVRNRKVELVRVRVGATNGQETEIHAGLVERDSVILHPTDQIRPGISVHQP